MASYEYDSLTHWQSKEHPIRLFARGRSRCCNRLLAVVQYSEGGYVKRMCVAPSCDETYPLSHAEFPTLNLQVTCKRCGDPMASDVVIYSNFGFRCNSCGASFRFADVLPDHPRLSRQLQGLT